MSEERDDSDVKTPDVEKPVLCSVSFSFELFCYCQESNKENSDFSIFKNKFGTFTHTGKPVRL